MTRKLRFGVHAGPSDNPYAARRDYWCMAERLGYDWASLSDHFIANPVFGARETDPWNEGWTCLAALAEATERIHIGILVSGVGYRNPGVLAKMAATVDVISGGRLEFGIGAGYLEAEYRMYGLPFPLAAVRIAQMDEAIQVCKLLWTTERADFAGQHFSLRGAVCEPKPVQRPHPPIWIGGMGEQKTLRVVAERADGWNAFPLPIAQLEHKLDVLRGHCQRVGRTFDSIQKQLGFRVIVREESTDAENELAQFARETSMPIERARQMAMVGTPDEIAERIAPYVRLGFDTLLLIERSPLDFQSLRLFMEQVAPRLRAA